MVPAFMWSFCHNGLVDGAGFGADFFFAAAFFAGAFFFRVAADFATRTFSILGRRAGSLSPP